MDKSREQSSPPIISEFANDPDMIELVELFVGELPSRIHSLQLAWEERRVEHLARLAHQLKGSSAGYGFPAIGEAAGSLEDRLRSLEDADADAAFSRLSLEFRELVDLCSRACRQAI